jgi:hypothetical protein
MATGPNWNPKRGTWYVQYWDGKWRRETVVKKMPGWEPGDPPPNDVPAKAFTEFMRLNEVELKARERAGKPVSRKLREEVEGYEVSNFQAFRDGVWGVLDLFLSWSQMEGYERLKEITPQVCALWLRDMAKGELEKGL